MLNEDENQALKGGRTRRILKSLPVFIVSLGVMSSAALVIRAAAGQPIRFNHQKHVSAVGLTCTDCHIYATSQPFAGLPQLESCLNCHEEPQTDSPEEKKLLALQAAGSELVWNRIYSAPNHVYFSHQRHVTAGELECAVCHGRMAERKTPPSGPEIPISMDRCMNCHKQKKVNNDCLSCHK